MSRDGNLLRYALGSLALLLWVSGFNTPAFLLLFINFVIQSHEQKSNWNRDVTRRDILALLGTFLGLALIVIAMEFFLPPESAVSTAMDSPLGRGSFIFLLFFCLGIWQLILRRAGGKPEKVEHPGSDSGSTG